METEAILAAMMAEANPREVPLRFFSHATCRIRGTSYKIRGSKLTKLMEYSGEFSEAEDVEFFYDIFAFIYETNVEYDYIMERAQRLLDNDPR